MAGRDASGVPPAVQWRDGVVVLLDQRKLPFRVEFVELRCWKDLVTAVREMVVRGAPAIGCAAAYGVALAARKAAEMDDPAAWVFLRDAAGQIRRARPTAVNLAWAVDRVMDGLESIPARERPAVALQRADAILHEDLEANRAIGRIGADLLPPQCRVLTHCNAGALATAGFGTALGVIREAYQRGQLVHVFADETRPRLQGMQLTAWELMQDGIPVTVLADGAAAWLMKLGKVDAIVVGADRIAANGDTANKIGTFGLAVAAAHSGVPFYVAAPLSTVDFSIPSGESIPIEERSAEEVTVVAGQRIGPEGVQVWNPAFDVTPASLITRIITEAGAVDPKHGGLRSLAGHRIAGAARRAGGWN